MILEERHQRIVSHISKSSFVSLGTLSKKFDVSMSTVRRDLDVLEDVGLVRRTHGGAVYIGERDSSLVSFNDRKIFNIKEKRAIGKCAAELVKEGETILLDNGTTSYQLALYLKDKKIQVVTNSLQISLLYANQRNIHLVSIGGELYPGTGSCLGPYAIGMIKNIRVEKAFIGVAGITEEGFYNSNAIVVDTERAMFESAAEVYIISDSTKYHKRSLAFLSGFAGINGLVTDSLPETSSSLFKKIEAEKFNVILADS